ncbi:MAG: AsmA family protein [Gammaproteobacteria bacterium]
MKRAITILSSIVAVIVLVLVVVLLTVDINQYKDDIVRVVETNTGRDFRIEGDIRLGLSLIPTVVIEKAFLGNAAWGSRETMLGIERLELSIAVLPLLAGDIQVGRFQLVRPDIYLETDARGQGNWNLQPGKEAAQQAEEAAPEEESTPLKLHFRRVLIEEAMITFRDGRSKQQYALSIESMDFRADGRDAPMNLEITAEFRELPVRFTGTTGSVEQLLTNSAFPVTLDAGVGDLSLHIDGSIERPLDVDDAALNLEARFGESDLSGKFGLDTTPARPVIAVELRSQQIDLTPFESEEEKQEKAADARLFSDEPLPVEQFRGVDVAASLDIEKVLSSRLPMENVGVRLQLQDGSLRVAPVTADVLGGKLTADLGLGAVGKDSMKLDFTFDIDGLQAAMLPQVRKKKYLSGGITDVSIRAVGTGNSVRAIMAGLNGGLLVKMGEGTIRNSAVEMAGADLITKTWSMLRPSDDEEKSTQLQCGVVNFVIKDGLAIADKGIALETRRMTVVGGGAVNLKTEELDLGIRPYAREGIGLSAGQLTELVRLRGTLANPETRPSTLAAMKTAATVGAAVVTGGISLVAGALFTRATADPHPCQTALGGKPVSDTQMQPAGDNGEKKSVGEKVKGVFKGLFGD